MMKKNNKGKRTLTAVGAVVAAGLTPGFIAVSATGATLQSPNAEVTAAEVVAIDGQVYSFDELYAMQNPNSAKMDTIELNIKLEPTNETLYGGPRVHAVEYGVQPIKRKNPREDDENAVYRSVEQMPQFPGGEAALMKYIKSHIQYPAEAVKNRIEGRAVVQFVVEKTGEIGEVKVLRSLGKDLDKEAVRLIKSLPKFTPGRMNGKAVSVWYTLPVTFTLPEE